MYYTCCVCNCSRQDAILHHFPCSEKRLNLWLKCIKRDDLYKLSQEELLKLFVCQKHFEKKFITPKLRLIATAYPSLFSEDEISSGTPTQIENQDPNVEHSYSRLRQFDHSYARKPLREVAGSGNTFNELQNLPGTSQTLYVAGGGSGYVSSHEAQNFPGTSQRSEVAGSGNTSNELQNLPGMSDTLYVAGGGSGYVSSHEAQNLPGTSRTSGVVFGKRKRSVLTRQNTIKKINDWSPNCKIIFKEYKKSTKQVDFLKRAKRALKFNKERSFEKLTRKMNPYGKALMKMQIDLCSKKKKGRRFTQEQKLIALSIMKQSPKCYRFLHKIFILPSKTTLNKMVAKLNIKTGICLSFWAD